MGEVADFYDGFAEYQLDYLKNGNARIDAVHKYLAPLIRERQPRRALDVGCGIGLTARWLTERIDEVVGVDISKRNIEIAVEVAPAATLLVADVPAMPLPDGPFDLVTLVDVIEHFPPDVRAAVFARLAGVISEDAVVAVNVPSKQFALAHSGDVGRQVIDEAVGAEEIVALAARLGMEPLTFQRYGIEFVGQYVFFGFARSYDVTSVPHHTFRERVAGRLARHGLRPRN